MKLFYAPASPFVRKVVVSALELGLNDRIERLPAAAHPVNRDQTIVVVNPIGKVPTFVTDDGEPLFDSRVICEYLDAQGGDKTIIPTGNARWRALREQALADGLLDAALLARYENTVRPEEYRWSPWTDAQMEKIGSALKSFDEKVFSYGDRVDLGTISIGCALGYLDFRFADLRWREGRGELAAWYTEFSKRDSMVATEPYV